MNHLNICHLTVYISGLAISVSDDSTSESDSDKSSISERVYCSIIDVLDDCQKCHYERNWDVMAIKFLYVSSVMIFYGKFSQILKNNFNSSPFAVGCTYAYMNSLTFTSSYFATVVKDRYTPFSPIILAERSFKLLGACLLVTCYSPTYILYMIMCAPVVFLNTFIDCIWEELLTTRNEDSLSKLNQNIKIAAGLTTPIIFGVFCNMIGHHAVIIFSVIPVIMSIYIINKYTKHYNFFEVEKKNE